ncbi:agamous-like MADS-box protein AGL36 [Phalaenopsis equestris]|uniref:agamous-like MADS-box protein AGL36 n=1 Tax=Phalaenopsis equestris TaxID=78828 RepID=UPI0009E49826|nr:agamous-like MADS-box protein AGL36 [Phalaenopsis equestris]
MGRAKLEMKYRNNSRARRATYITRVTGLKKKASELSLLCGVDVLVASFSPELNAVQSWPEQDSDEFRWIKERYVQFRRSEMATPFPSPSLPLASQEMLAMSSKLTEIRERLRFLQGEASSNAATASSHFQQDQTALQVQDTIPLSPFPTHISMEDAPEFFLSDSPMRSSTDDFAWCDSLLDYEKW